MPLPAFELARPRAPARIGQTLHQGHHVTEPTPFTRRLRGFQRAATLVEPRIRAVGESRGFAVAKVLTHWAEIAGAEMAAMAHPVKVSYPTSGIGATLTVLTTGSNAPFVEMQKESLRERVNACYGYNAVTRIRITQTAPQGFAEAQAAFGRAPAPPPETPPDPQTLARAADAAAGIRDGDLRAALEQMGRTVLSRPKPKDIT
jgi:hypothetical protein